MHTLWVSSWAGQGRSVGMLVLVPQTGKENALRLYLRTHPWVCGPEGQHLQTHLLGQGELCQPSPTDSGGRRAREEASEGPPILLGFRLRASCFGVKLLLRVKCEEQPCS